MDGSLANRTALKDMNRTNFLVLSMDIRTIAYLSFGTVNTVCNYFIVFVLLTDRTLLKKSILPMALAIGNSFDGVYKITRGLTALLRNPDLRSMVTVLACALEIRPSLELISYQAPAAILIVSGLERLIAVTKPAWYQRMRSWKTMVWVAIAIYGYILCVPVGIHFMDAWNRRDSLVDSQCEWRIIVDRRLRRYLNFTSAIGGAVCVFCTLSALFVCMQRARTGSAHRYTSKISKRLGRQLQLTKSMLCIASLDFLFVVTPNLLLLIVPLAEVPRPASAYVSFACLLCYCANSIPHPFVYMRFNGAFRKAALRMLGVVPSSARNTAAGSKSKRST